MRAENKNEHHLVVVNITAYIVVHRERTFIHSFVASVKFHPLPLTASGQSLKSPQLFSASSGY
jgi:hypothetical protein